MFKIFLFLILSISSLSQAVPFGQVFNGIASFYNNPGLGSCGSQIDAGTEMLVAAPAAHWTSGNPNSDPLCTENVYIKVTYNGNVITVPVKDKCPSCPPNKIDLSKPAFAQLANLDVGIIQITWEYVRGSGPSSSTPSSSGSPPIGSGSSSGGNGQTVTVVGGDTCYAIWTTKCGHNWDQSAFSQANPSVNCASLQIGQQISCGGSGDSGSSSSGTTVVGGTSSSSGSGQTITVVGGDTCYAIWTTKCGHSWDQSAFSQSNPGVNCASLQIGQQVSCGGSGGGSPSPNSIGGTSSSSGSGQTVTVVGGDTCYAIWTTKCGHSWDQSAFSQANPGVNCASLQIGQQVKCGGGGSGGSPSSNSIGGTSSSSGSGQTVTVVGGDTCYAIWTTKCGHNWDQSAFSQANPSLNCASLQIGQQVSCGGSGGSGVPSSSSSNSIGGTSSSGGSGQTVTVVGGDTCYAIWTTKCGHNWDQSAFSQANPSLNCASLQIGQRVSCGGSGGSGVANQGGAGSPWSNSGMSSSSSSSSSGCSKNFSAVPGDTCYGIWTTKCSNPWIESAFFSKNAGINCAALQVGQQVCC
ncbi:hypothetical protein PPL_02928 [Heterostelium album PN500]|uniref:Uncharacterized protein n=1 Tax=Heterostelium pallidum (strain ATCC 26659 / Pp 5 / PN500) TaxID=670386 RepID=D3B3G0_HETP5|nr:hypothetical protein PPL_02928 [Heterostelium album PN500]EFA83858.1 hypothetical protein PPL_02928 [Heterostelium album PN500]|eukprot:XP_020435975.1 hypothetical protein PPL_02928 [Heterostelium album PN500]